jgi:hypothetical protein
MPTMPEPLVTLLTSVDYRRTLGLIVEARNSVSARTDRARRLQGDRR